MDSSSGLSSSKSKQNPIYTLPVWRDKHLRRYRSQSKTVTAMLKEYARETSFHGLQYVFHERSSILDRIIWLAVLLASLCCTVVLCTNIVQRYIEGPTVTVVRDTHYPLYYFPFPGVTVCPIDKIKRDTAFHYIRQYAKAKLNLSKEQIQTHAEGIDQFLGAMAMFQHPYYFRMAEFLERCEKLLPRLSVINLTDFMIQVLPTCDEVFSTCFWHGLTESCCDIFHIQRSEEGFCYSFNSFTSQKLNHCPQLSYDEKAALTKKEIVDSECVLRRNSAAGPSTGLQVFLHRFNISQAILNWTSISGESGVRVQLHTSTEYPDSAMGVLVPAMSGVKMSTSVKPYLTESLIAVRTLRLTERNCYFPDERRLDVAAQYSQSSCLIQCRLEYFRKVCGCRPYYFNMLDNRVPICNASQLMCIAQHGSNVKFYRPPIRVQLRGFDEKETATALNCSNCLPTCHESYYDDDSDLSSDTQQKALESYGFLDIFYKDGGAVYYQRDVTFGAIDLLVSIGGTAGLFLGISLLSVVELVYWIVKFTLYGIHKRDTKLKHKLPKSLVYSKDFYN